MQQSFEQVRLITDTVVVLFVFGNLKKHSCTLSVKITGFGTGPTCRNGRHRRHGRLFEQEFSAFDSAQVQNHARHRLDRTAK